MNPIVRCCFICLLGFSSVAYSLSSDNQQPALMQADSGEHNFDKGIGHYRGHVIMDQGTTHVSGDRAIAYNDKNNKVTQIKVYGQPARYRTLTERDKPELVATADLIIYYPQKRYAKLIGNAVVTQEGKTVRGPELLYWMQSQLVVAPPNKQGSVSVVIPPDQKEQKHAS